MASLTVWFQRSANGPFGIPAIFIPRLCAHVGFPLEFICADGHIAGESNDACGPGADEVGHSNMAKGHG